MNPLRALKRRISQRLRGIIRSEIEAAIPLMQRIADFAASAPEQRQSAHDLTRDPLANAPRYATVVERLRVAGVPVEPSPVDAEDFERWRAQFQAVAEHCRHFGEVRVEKELEYYLSYRQLAPQAGQVYIDVAASSCTLFQVLRGQGVDAYRLDLSYPPGRHGNDIGADAARTGLPDAFADHLAVHCALECFAGDADVRFFQEAARILKPGGRCVVVPLYVNETHYVTSSPYSRNGASPQTADPEGLFLWRDDSYVVPFDRAYSPETFAARIHAALPPSLTGRVLYADNIPELMGRYPGQRIYCFLQYLVEKRS